MADGPDTTGTSGQPPRRPPKRTLSTPGRSPAPGATAPPNRPGRRGGPRPWWRRGRTWFVVIVVEALGALVVANVAIDRLADISLDGADVAAFCSGVTRYRQLEAVRATVDVDAAGDVLEREAAAYRELERSAPTDVREDFERLAVITDDLAADAREIKARRASDPSYQGLPALIAKQEAAAARAARFDARVKAAIIKACGVDVDTPVTTAGTVPSAPSGSAPGGTTPSATDGAAPSSEPTTTAAG